MSDGDGTGPERRPGPAAGTGAGLVWYVAYGSNLARRRFECYLGGGVPPGGRRANPGARDASAPRASRPLWLAGRVYFALHSSVWSGGMAFYDPDAAGPTPARGYLLTDEQFSDVLAQEMHRSVGDDVDLGLVPVDGRLELGPGRYETLVGCGKLDGVPLVTATAPGGVAQAALRAPSVPYLDMLAAGLVETHGFTAEQCARYLAGLPGAAGTWEAIRLADRWSRSGR